MAPADGDQTSLEEDSKTPREFPKSAEVNESQEPKEISTVGELHRPSSPDSWTEVSSTIASSGYQLGLDLDGTTPRPGTGSTRLRTPLVIPEYDAFAESRVSPSSDGLRVLGSSFDEHGVPSPRGSPRASLSPRQSAETNKNSSPWNRRWIPPAKGRRASPKRWFPLRSRLDLPTEAKQMHINGKLAGRPYAEKMQRIKSGGNLNPTETAESDDPFRIPGITDRYMHDMYMSSWELHHRLRKGLDLVRAQFRKPTPAEMIPIPPESVQPMLETTPEDHNLPTPSQVAAQRSPRLSTPRSPRTPRIPSSRGRLAQADESQLLETRVFETRQLDSQAPPLTTRGGSSGSARSRPSLSRGSSVRRPDTSGGDGGGAGGKIYHDSSPEGRWEAWLAEKEAQRDGRGRRRAHVTSPARHEDRPDLARGSTPPIPVHRAAPSSQQEVPAPTPPERSWRGPGRCADQCDAQLLAAAGQMEPVVANHQWIPALFVPNRYPSPARFQQIPGTAPSLQWSPLWPLPSPRPTTTYGPYSSPQAPKRPRELAPAPRGSVQQPQRTDAGHALHVQTPRPPQQARSPNAGSYGRRSLTHRATASPRETSLAPNSARGPSSGRGWAFDDDNKWSLEADGSDVLACQGPPTQNGLLLAKLCLALHTTKGSATIATKAREMVERIFGNAASILLLRKTGYATVCDYEGGPASEISLAHEGIVATSLHKKVTLKADLYRDPGLCSQEDEVLGIRRVGVVYASPLATSKTNTAPAFGVMVVQKTFGLFDQEELEILTTLCEHVRAAMMQVGEGMSRGGSAADGSEQGKGQVFTGASAINSRPPVA